MQFFDKKEDKRYEKDMAEQPEQPSPERGERMEQGEKRHDLEEPGFEESEEEEEEEEERHGEPSEAVVKITRQAFELYKTYTAVGKVIPAGEVLDLRKEVTSLPKQELKDLRAELGIMALEGGLVVDDKDIGNDIFGMIFGPQDLQVLKDVKLIASAINARLNDYQITNMLRLRRTFLEWEGRTRLPAKEQEQLQVAEERLTNFLTEVVKEETKQRLLLAKEVKEELRVNKELGVGELVKETKGHLHQELTRLRAELSNLWQEFQEMPFANVGPVVDQILSLYEAKEALTKALKTRGAGKTGETFDVERLAQVGGRLRLAKHTYEGVESEEKRIEELHKKKKKQDQKRAGKRGIRSKKPEKEKKPKRIDTTSPLRLRERAAMLEAEAGELTEAPPSKEGGA